MGGISRQLNTKKLKNSSSMSSLKTIVWPGDSTTKPKGWAIPPYGKEKLKVLVPAKTGFNQFVSMEKDPPLTNKAVNITGFCIEVFRNITNILPFGLPYEFQFYPLDGENLRSYDELIDQVYLKNFGAAVGDISILENRSKYVDFTLPYTDSGVTMVVAVKDNVNKELFSFLQPLSFGLWMVTLLGFICIGLVVWILEHQRNPELGSSPGQQLQTSMWFSFLTLVFSQREKIEGISTRVVLFAWMFFVLILTQSYTANLSSILTTQQLQPTITDVEVLKSNEYNVGYQAGSFVEGFLLNYLHFDKSKLKGYGSPEEYHSALSNGSDNGGVAAIFDEIPYIQVFLNMYCNQYTTVGRVYSSEGFGFRWIFLQPYLESITWKITHNFREANSIADYLARDAAKTGISAINVDFPANIKDFIRRDADGRPNYRFD
ncbi:glutamate receptor 2.1-like [Macadamia integrifolia]|uniref:glutamate receptor 2.1-like n=1 Tax=Macadamia integrifolia TaxID=60698 RepID=UPI001C4FC158|nr:glutamate receptor 2.1-like [Macadamia integrifolia]